VKITSRASITSSPLVLKEGIIANNDILTFEEFKVFMKERLNKEVITLMLSRFN
jgi:predicted thioredoxin/glutaredoxin